MQEPIDGFELHTVAEGGSLAQTMQALVEAVWPRYVTEASTPPGYDAETDWFGVYTRWPELQFALVDPTSGDIVAAGNMVSLAWNEPSDRLPRRGWTWAMQTARADLAAGREPNVACGLSVTVAPEWRGQHVSQSALRAMSAIARSHGWYRLIVPVRPVWKARYPITPMADYASWTDDAGLPFDPWLRTHIRMGARAVAICDESMFYGGTIEQWEDWTGLRLPASGDFVAPGLLSLLHVDLDADLGVSIEPNVWMEHELN